MKFKKDGAGWRDLTVGDDSKHVQISVSAEGQFKAFIGVADGYQYASRSMTRGELRRMARAILKETEK